jgi:Cu/Ag efflux pump CusA
VLVGIFILPFLGESLFPEFKERDFLIHFITKPGGSVPGEDRMDDPAQQGAAADPGVRNFGSHIGQALLAEEIASVNFGECWISIDPKADYNETHTPSRTWWTATRACSTTSRPT